MQKNRQLRKFFAVFLHGIKRMQKNAFRRGKIAADLFGPHDDLGAVSFGRQRNFIAVRRNNDAVNQIGFLRFRYAPCQHRLSVKRRDIFMRDAF